MPILTVFRKTTALLGDHRDSEDAIAVINCDDKYVKTVSKLQGRVDLKKYLSSTKQYKFFFECEILVDMSLPNTFNKNCPIEPSNPTTTMMNDIYRETNRRINMRTRRTYLR